MSSSPELILAIDCGSTNMKAALFDAGLARLAEHAVPVTYVVHDHETGVVEMDARCLWDASVELSKQVCRRARVETSDVDRISFTSQAQTFTGIDADGTPVIPFISWIDSRATEECGEVNDRLGRDLHKHCSFAPAVPQLQLCKTLWLQRHCREAMDRVAVIASLPGFLCLRLGGINLMDDNLAAMSGLYSMAGGDWWGDALEFAGLRRDQLPAVNKVGATLPCVRACPDVRLARDAAFVLAGNDQTAGAFGNHCQHGGMVVTLGTALVVYRFAGQAPGPYHPGACWGPYPHNGFYELATTDKGCQALDWARGQLSDYSDVAAFLRAAESAAAEPTPGEPCFFYPARIGSAAAWNGSSDPERRALAVLEGITFSLRRLMEYDLQTEDKPATICVIGGGSNSEFWLRLVADVLECPVRKGNGDSLVGAAMMALPLSDTTQAMPQATIHPDPERAALYERAYAEWSQQQR